MVRSGWRKTALAAALMRRRQQLQDELTKSSPVTRVGFRDQCVHVKRDDVFHLAGNKMRKLHWFVKQDDAFYEDAHLISFGGTQSNAMLAIAQLAQARGVPFMYFSRGLQLRTDASASIKEECVGTQQPSGNLALALELGMQHVELSPTAYQELARTKDFNHTIKEHAYLQHLLEEHNTKNVVFVPQGAAFERAHEGLEALAYEINAYVTNEQNKDKRFSVVVPAGTGTTALYMAQYLDPTRARLFAVPCVGDAVYLQQQFVDLIERDAALTQRAETHTLTLPTILAPDQKARFGRLSWPLYDMHYELLAATQVEFDLVYGCFAWQTMFTERNLTKLLHGDGRDQPEQESHPRELLYVHTGGASGNATMLARDAPRLLYEASRIDVTKLEANDGDDDDVSVKSLLGSRVKDPKATRQLSSEITQSGAKLFDLLEAELDVRDARQHALRFLDAISNNSENSSEQKYLERSIKEILQQTQESVEMTERQHEELEAEEKALASKMKKAQTDLERSEKRLKSLQHVRPAFMDEYEKLEKELERQYAIYCERFRNLDYLQRELDLHNSRELKKLAENDRSLKKLQKKFRDDELAILRGEQEDQMENGLLDDNNNSGSNQKAKAVNGAQQSSSVSNKKRATSDDESGSEDESGSDDDGSSDGSLGNDDDRSSGSDLDQVSVADSAELIDNDDDSGGSDGSEDDGGGSGSGSETNSDSDQDF